MYRWLDGQERCPSGEKRLWEAAMKKHVRSSQPVRFIERLLGA